MFGFGKKKLTADAIGNISMEIAMFMRWMEVHRHRMLLTPEVHGIAVRLLDRENRKYTSDDVMHIVMSAMTISPRAIDAMNKKTRSEIDVDLFCRKIGITTIPGGPILTDEEARSLVKKVASEAQHGRTPPIAG